MNELKIDKHYQPIPFGLVIEIVARDPLAESV